jgi:hypothetical protein
VENEDPQYLWPLWLAIFIMASLAVLRFGLIVLATATFTSVLS